MSSGGWTWKTEDGSDITMKIKILVINLSLLLQIQLMWLNPKDHSYYQGLVNYISHSLWDSPML